MNKQEQVQQMTTYMANFVSHIAKVLPDDIIAKLDELGAQEDAPLSKVIYETMKRNQKPVSYTHLSALRLSSASFAGLSKPTN